MEGNFSLKCLLNMVVFCKMFYYFFEFWWIEYGYIKDNITRVIF